MQETIARIPAQERIVHVARDDVGWAAARYGAGRDHLSRRALRIDFDLTVAQATRRPGRLCRAAARQRNPRAAAQMAARRSGCGSAHARCRLRAPRAPALRPEAEQLEYALLRYRGRSLSGDARGFSVCATRSKSVCRCSRARPDGSRARRRRRAGSWRRWIPQARSSSREEFVARAYGAFCAAAATLDVSRGRLVPYESLPAAVWDIVAPHFSLSIDPSQRDRIAEAARRHAKAAIGTVTEFRSDVAAKQDAASAQLRLAIDSLARPQLERLMRLHADTMRR